MSIRSIRLPWGLGRAYTIMSGLRTSVCRIVLSQYHTSIFEDTAESPFSLHLSIHQDECIESWRASLLLRWHTRNWTITFGACSAMLKRLRPKAKQTNQGGSKKASEQSARKARVTTRWLGSPVVFSVLGYTIQKSLLYLTCGRNRDVTLECRVTKSSRAFVR